MTPQPTESTFFKAPVVAIHQSLLHATENVFGMMGWVATRGPSLLPFSFWKASSADQFPLGQEYVCVEVKLLSGAEVQLRVVSIANFIAQESLHYARAVLAYHIISLSATVSPTNCDIFDMCSAQRGSNNACVAHLNVSCALPPFICV